MKKLLYYNWIQFDNDEKKGGGVNSYQRNIIEELLKEDGIEIYFISSGREYNLIKRNTYIKETKNIFGERCRTFRIVNSPILAPGKYLKENDISIYLNDTVLYDILNEFITQNGGFDVIHFNNLEGLSLNILKLKENFKETKFIYSLHNYYAFCPQVELWANNEQNCRNYCDGARCVKCIPRDIYNSKIIINLSMNYYLMENYSKLKKSFFNEISKYLNYIYRIRRVFPNTRNLMKVKNSKIFKEYREKNIQYINKYIDVIVAVSDRVRSIAINMGIDEEKLYLSYIGTKFADVRIIKNNDKINCDIFQIIYMGYMKKYKGFYFFLDALSNIDNRIAKSINIILATKIIDVSIIKRIEKLREKYNDIKIIDGYTHEELPSLLENCHLGIVPVLWEDNLPQVAIEMVAHGVPVLASDLGGASELSNSNLFKFKNGNIEDFNDKLIKIINNREILEKYWEKYMPLKTMNQHVEELKDVYGFN